MERCDDQTMNDLMVYLDSQDIPNVCVMAGKSHVLNFECGLAKFSIVLVDIKEEKRYNVNYTEGGKHLSASMDVSSDAIQGLIKVLIDPKEK